jgi:K+-transporting ATPase ATPase C chain
MSSPVSNPVSTASMLLVSARFTLTAILGAGLLWPLVTTGLAGALFPEQAQGSVIVRGGFIVGSALVAQPTVSPGYFSPRPSAAGYDPRAAAGSNLAATNPALREQAQARLDAIVAREGVRPEMVPAELLLASGSGLDPHISPEAARLQAPRVAQARGRSVEAVNTLIDTQTESGLGPARVNVLLLNLKLDEQAIPR